MSIPNKAKGTIRTLKNYTKGFSEIQKKVREATSNDPVGPSGSLLNAIARATFSHYRFVEVMEIIDKRMNDSGKNWRHVFKALTVMEFLIHNGSEDVVNHCKSNLYLIKTLREFQYVDEQSRDQGANVRHKAKDVTELLTNEEKLKEMRAHINEKLHSSYGNYANDAGYGTGYGTEGYKDSFGSGVQDQRSGLTAEDRELALAIEESKRMAQTKTQNLDGEPDDDLRKALELSKREAELRERSLAKENELVLLDDYDPTPTPNNPQLDHMKQFDFFGNLIHEPATSAVGGGPSDLLDLDPIHFSGQNSGLQQANMGYTSYRPTGYGQPNPFSQTSPNFSQTTNQAYNSSHQTQFPQSNGGYLQTTGAFTKPTLSVQTSANNNYTGLDNAFTSNDPVTQSFLSSPQQTAPGFHSQFKGAYDGGFNAKLLPHQQHNNANAALATVARNSSQIDPFASLATARSKSPAPRSGLEPPSSSSNPFYETWSNGPNTTNASASGQSKPSSMDLFNHSSPNNPFAPHPSANTPTNSHGNQNLFF